MSIYKIIEYMEEIERELDLDEVEKILEALAVNKTFRLSKFGTSYIIGRTDEVKLIEADLQVVSDEEEDWWDLGYESKPDVLVMVID